MNLPPDTIVVRMGEAIPRLYIAQVDGTNAKSAFFRKATPTEIVAGIVWAEGRIVKLNAQLDIALEGVSI